MTQATLVSLHGETCVADDAQDVVVVFLIPEHGFLVVGSQHYLGTSSLALCSGVRIQGFRGEVFALCQDVVIQVWEYGGVETDVVLHQQYHLHTSLLDVVLDVHLVLNELDDGQNEIGIA